MGGVPPGLASRKHDIGFGPALIDICAAFADGPSVCKPGPLAAYEAIPSCTAVAAPEQDEEPLGPEIDRLISSDDLVLGAAFEVERRLGLRWA